MLLAIYVSSYSFVPRAVPALSGYVVRQVAAGGAHCVAVTHCGLVFAWGSGRFGQVRPK
jgi:alpha-tubulin suppressor-like RCC1 family protein